MKTVQFIKDEITIEERSIEYRESLMLEGAEQVAKALETNNLKNIERYAKEVVAASKDVAKGKKAIRALKEELKKAEAEEIKEDDSLQPIKDFLETIYQEDLKYHVEVKDLFFKTYGASTTKAIKGGMKRNAIEIAQLPLSEGEKLFRKDLEARYKKIEKAVKERVGNEIIDLELDRNENGGLDGYIRGNEAVVFFQTILAGGYNIQRLHYRTIMKEYK